MAFTDPIKIGIRQIERWMRAANQDDNPGIKMLHSNYAVGDLDMLILQFSKEQIKAKTGKDVRALYMRAIQLQDEASREILMQCPGIQMPSYNEGG